MKKLLILSFLITFYFTSVAQESVQGFRVGGGLSVVAPIGNNLNAYSVGVGLDLLGQYGISSQIAITGDVGYTTIFAKNDGVDAFNIIPIRAGIRFFPSDKFYLGGKAGVGILTGSGNSTSGFAYGVGAGFRMDDKLDIGLNYDAVSKNSTSFSYLGLRLVYFFN